MIKKIIEKIDFEDFMLICIFMVSLGMVFCAHIISDAKSDWLVIKEDSHGKSIQYWELKATHLTKDIMDNMIYFSDENGNIIHLTEPYTYIKVKGSFEQTKQKYLKGIK